RFQTRLFHIYLLLLQLRMRRSILPILKKKNTFYYSCYKKMRRLKLQPKFQIQKLQHFAQNSCWCKFSSLKFVRKMKRGEGTKERYLILFSSFNPYSMPGGADNKMNLPFENVKSILFSSSVEMLIEWILKSCLFLS